jgi:hypothetical protein
MESDYPEDLNKPPGRFYSIRDFWAAHTNCRLRAAGCRDTLSKYQMAWALNIPAKPAFPVHRKAPFTDRFF